MVMVHFFVLVFFVRTRSLPWLGSRPRSEWESQRSGGGDRKSLTGSPPNSNISRSAVAKSLVKVTAYELPEPAFASVALKEQSGCSLM